MRKRIEGKEIESNMFQRNQTLDLEFILMNLTGTFNIQRSKNDIGKGQIPTSNNQRNANHRTEAKAEGMK
jgi:hypothetical protein